MFILSKKLVSLLRVLIQVLETGAPLSLMGVVHSPFLTCPMTDQHPRVKLQTSTYSTERQTLNYFLDSLLPDGEFIWESNCEISSVRRLTPYFTKICRR